MSAMAVVSAFLIGTLCIHLVICRITRPGHFLLKGLTTGVAGCLALAIFRGMHGAPWVLETYLLISTWIIYIMAFINLMNSVTLKMLALLNEAPQFILETDRLANVLNDENGFDSRFVLMERSGLIAPDGSTLSLTQRGQVLAYAISVTRALMATESGAESSVN